jgi:hypothetical protein
VVAEALADVPLRVVHVLLLVAWLGVDVGVFYASWRLVQPGRSAETRLELVRVLVALDRSPRVSLILMVPVALGLAHASGLGLFGLSDGEANALFWPLVAVALAWSAALLRAEHVSQGGAVETRFTRAYHVLDTAARLAVVGFFGASGILALAGVWDVWAHHVAVKALLFACIVLVGRWIEWSFRGFPAAFAELVEAGETPERLARLRASVVAAYPPVLTIYALLVATTVVAVARP